MTAASERSRSTRLRERRPVVQDPPRPSSGAYSPRLLNTLISGCIPPSVVGNVFLHHTATHIFD